MATLIIGGTTASGKSGLAIELARRHNAAIVSADAMTVYRGLDIGTAKPTEADRRSALHLGIDTRDIDQDCDVTAFCSLVERSQLEHKNLIIAGGTTFWLSALVRPLADLPASRPEVREELERLDNPHAALMEIDPAAAERLHPHDRLRIIRALEVHALSGKTQTQLHEEGAVSAPVDAEVCWLDHEDLASRIQTRLEAMVDAGYLAEVDRILEEGWSPACKPLRSFAYRHMLEHKMEALSLDEALRRTARDTRHFAKKQRNWARSLGWQATDHEEVYSRAKLLFRE